MLLLLASVSAQLPAQVPTRMAAAAPATVTVRVVRAAEVRAGRLAATEESLLRKTTIVERDGSERAASLIEFY
jgi:hypothetical protein